MSVEYNYIHNTLYTDLFHELNVGRFEFGKTDELSFNHPESTHDGRFRAVTSPLTHKGNVQWHISNSVNIPFKITTFNRRNAFDSNCSKT